MKEEHTQEPKKQGLKLKDLRLDKRGIENKVDQIGRRPSGGEELERTVRDHGSTPGRIRGLLETERSQVGF